MKYIYNITVNFKKEFLNFYEWNNTDKLTILKKVKAYKIDNKSYYDVLKYNIITEYKNETIILCNDFDSICIKFDSEGNSILRSKLSIDEEISVLEIMYKEITLEDLLYGLLLVSGNDASMTIANNIMKYDDFINEMNRKAIKLGMLNTTFENPHGLNDDTKNYSTAYDLALLMKYAIKNETFVKISSTKKHKAKTNMNEYIWYNKNDLLSYKYCTAGKIGYTKASGQVFVSSASKDNKNLVIVSIDEANKFELHKSYYEKYFKMYNKYKIIDSYLFTLNDKRYNDYYMYISKDVDLLLTESELDNLKIKAKINNKLVNGVSGSLNFYINEKLIYKEKIYYVKYNERVNKIRSLLSFFK